MIHIQAALIRGVQREPWLNVSIEFLLCPRGIRPNRVSREGRVEGFRLKQDRGTQGRNVGGRISVCPIQFWGTHSLRAAYLFLNISYDKV